MSASPSSQHLKIGDKIEVVVDHADFTTVLHDAFDGFRGDRLETAWLVAARGMLE